MSNSLTHTGLVLHNYTLGHPLAMQSCMHHDQQRPGVIYRYQDYPGRKQQKAVDGVVVRAAQGLK